MIVGILKFATSFDHSDCMMHHLHGSEDGCQNRQCLGPGDDGIVISVDGDANGKL